MARRRPDGGEARMSVKAPAEKNFRRAQGAAGRRRKDGARRALAVVARRPLGGRVLVVVALRRLSRHRRWCCTPPACRSAASPCTATCGCRAARCRRSSTGCAAPNILTADLPGYRRRLLESPWVADAALRRVLPSTVEVFVSERAADGPLPARQRALPGRSARHADRRVRAAVRGVRPADHRRPGRARRAAGSRRSTRRAPSWRRA